MVFHSCFLSDNMRLLRLRNGVWGHGGSAVVSRADERRAEMAILLQIIANFSKLTEKEKKNRKPQHDTGN